MEAANATRNPFADLPPHVFDLIHQFLLGVANQRLDLQEAHMRPSVAKIYPFIVFMYSALVFVGVVANLAVVYHVVRHGLYKDPTYSFVINNAVSDVVKCVCVLPISLYVLLMQNWTLGELLCSFLPMLQVCHCPLSTIYYALSTIHCPLFTIH